jgi:transcriptional regulator with XRE-family HTH domain
MQYPVTDMNLDGIGVEIGRRRRLASLTQAALAERMGTTQAAISKVEAGRNLPSLGFLERFARATGQPFELVIGHRQSQPSRAELRRRVRRVLGDYRFDPWERMPTDVEARSLLRDGLTRERFQSQATPGGGVD